MENSKKELLSKTAVEPIDNGMYQIISIEFEGGKSVSLPMPYIFTTDQVRNGEVIPKSVAFSEPRILPRDVSFTGSAFAFEEDEDEQVGESQSPPTDK